MEAVLASPHGIWGSSWHPHMGLGGRLSLATWDLGVLLASPHGIGGRLSIATWDLGVLLTSPHRNFEALLAWDLEALEVSPRGT